ncbi:MAG: hypothetical protein LBD48_01325 [Treponema sp.]|jgi:hypothetical protein|nr:hypothetical protein [Treponema sp.]
MDNSGNHIHFLDVSRAWHILAPASASAAQYAAEELAAYFGLLRERAGLDKEQPPIEDAETVSPPGAAPLILLNTAAGDIAHNGFTWRLGNGRIEIHGDSARGLWNGVFDFLSALGFRWPKPGVEELPAAPSGENTAAYPLKDDRAYSPSAANARERRRLVINEKTGTRERERLIRWAARNKIDALVFSLREKSFWDRAGRGGKIYGAERYALALEAGGGDLSLLLPRSLFLFHQDMFRMESGKRTREHHFCPTNPKTTARITRRAKELFGRALPGMTAQSGEPVFHLWPDSEHEKTWCACPACRAFSPAEQNRIAVNTAADALSAAAPAALLSYKNDPGESGGIAPRKNTFVLSPLTVVYQ